MKKVDLNKIKKYQEVMPINIEKHPEADIYIIGYYKNPFSDEFMVWNEDTLMCRGIIVDNEGNILESPYKKFFTFRQYLSNDTILMSNNRVARINPQTKVQRITEKLDGTMCVLYWVNDIPYLSTQRSFVGEKVERANEILHNKYLNQVHNLDRNYTYVFEAIYPEAKILIEYGDTEDLFLIGKIDRETGLSEELSEDLGFPVCKDLTSDYDHLDLDQIEALDIKKAEGFVVTYENGVMIKVKFPWYKEAHGQLDELIGLNFLFNKSVIQLSKTLSHGRQISNLDVLKALINNDYTFNTIKKSTTDLHYLSGLDKWLEEQAEEITSLVNKEKRNNEYQNDQEVLEKLILPEIKHFEFGDEAEIGKKMLKADNTMIHWRKRMLKEYH